jgi:hypothetical protein
MCFEQKLQEINRFRTLFLHFLTLGEDEWILDAGYSILDAR